MVRIVTHGRHGVDVNYQSNSLTIMVLDYSLVCIHDGEHQRRFRRNSINGA